VVPLGKSVLEKALYDPEFESDYVLSKWAFPKN
jgi:hypothetical protein